MTASPLFHPQPGTVVDGGIQAASRRTDVVRAKDLRLHHRVPELLLGGCLRRVMGSCHQEAIRQGELPNRAHGVPELSSQWTCGVTYWGTGDEPFDLTTVDDTARFTARLAVDPAVQAGVHTISAGPTTYKDITRTIERATGRTLTPQILGDEQQLRDVIATKDDPWDAVYEWYALGMLKAPTFATNENNRYEDAQPTLVEDYLTAAYENAVVR